jgi:universal stress protein E
MQPISSILVDVDATAQAQPALERALRIARGCGARLTLVDVIPVPSEARSPHRTDPDHVETRCRRAQLARLANSITGLTVDSQVLLGSPALALTQEVLRSGHDLLVRSHARDLVARGPKPFGDVDTQLFRKCPCPVWAIGQGPVPQHPRIVGAVHPDAEDPIGRQMNAKIIELAVFITDLEAGALTLLQAWQPFGERSIRSHTTDEAFSAYLHLEQRRAAESLTNLKDSFGEYLAGVQVDLRRGDAEQVIPEFVVARGIDLVVLGTVARRGIAGLLIGNTAERLLHKLPCSVLAVKPDGFVSPVRLDEPA